MNPILDDSEIDVLDDIEIKNLAINCYSCIKKDNRKINYISYIKSMHNQECNKAIKRVFDKINIGEINKFIDNIEAIANSRKEFYKKIINIRYEIINKVYESL